jgi:hypothetical protein
MTRSSWDRRLVCNLCGYCVLACGREVRGIVGWCVVCVVIACLRAARTCTFIRVINLCSGSLICLALALGLDFERIRDFQLNCVDRTHGSIAGAFRLKQYVDEIMDDMLPDDAYRTISDRVEVSFSTLPVFSNRRVNRFRDNAHLRQAIHASCCMAPLCGTPFELDGDLVYDGAISDWLGNNSFLTCPEGHMATNSAAVRVTPFWFSRSDIRPSQYIPLWWALYPPRRSDFEWVFDLGYRDGVDWVQRHAAVFRERSGPHWAPCSSAAERPPPHNLAADSPDHSSGGEGVEEGRVRRSTSSSSSIQRRSAPRVRDKGREVGRAERGKLKGHDSHGWTHPGKPTGAFTRAFGYRSILYTVPSWMIDFVVLCWLIVLVKPLMTAVVYLGACASLCVYLFVRVPLGAWCI